jgi:hypothetical protein
MRHQSLQMREVGEMPKTQRRIRINRLAAA